MGDPGGYKLTAVTKIVLCDPVARFVAVILPDAVGPTVAGVDTDALLAAARSELEASAVARLHASALAAVIPATIVYLHIHVRGRAPHGDHPVLLVKVEVGKEIGA